MTLNDNDYLDRNEYFLVYSVPPIFLVFGLTSIADRLDDRCKYCMIIYTNGLA